MFRVVMHPSPNRSSRGGVVVDTIMLHSTGSGLSSALDWLCKRSSRVSAHYVVAKDGTVYKLVPVSETAWHAGRCRVAKANARSIGIEVEQLLNEVWTPEQYDVVLRLIAVLKRAIPTIKYLVGHFEWNSRKIDPFNINLDRLREVTGLGRL